MRVKNQFDRNENQFFENQLRSYPDLNRKIETSKLLGNVASEFYYTNLKRDIDETFSRLPENLQELIEDYFWGEKRYISDWSIIGQQCFSSERNGYSARAQIIEEFTKVRGILIR